ncbi:MAG: N-6 DNA methylase, partial [Synergistaceae bacterium]|nr:N-6 DNA methylase [Synergistaceae bacterium]
DRVSGLIGVFQDPALDFRSNRASGDDIIGDAYEYFMMKFAQESGKSKGQFYTPAEVSRIIARLIGIGNVTEKVTVYDPAAGSGSLLIRAADEAPVNSSGFSLASIYGQEIDISTAGLAKMNFILHQRGTGQIQKGNTLSDPKYLDEFGQLERFDFIVMNPPFSQKSWSDGVNIESDIYNRFEGFGIPPMKNGDYAWLLHVIKSLAQNGKAGIVLPHGVLFRGNAEEIIRIQLIKTKYIRGIVSLPPNLFYGVGIPACLMFIDKENAPAREGIFFIDASNGFKKDGNKNRLREQDIERIVRVYNAQQEIEGYSRLVPYSEILESNGGNLNVPRYIQKPDDTLPHNITAHLNGGIPEYDINTLAKIWRISPSLKEKIFAFTDGGIYRLAVKAEETEKIFGDDETLRAQKLTEGTEIFAAWADEARDSLMNINGDTNPRNLIRELGDSILSHYDMAMIVDKYSVFDVLMNYWNGAMQDDVYMIRAYGWEAGRNIAYEYDKKGKITSWEGELIPREIIEHEYFSHELDAIEALSDETASLNAEIEDLRGDSDPDDELPPETLKTISRKENEARKLSREAKRLRKELDEAVIKKYKDLSVDEIKRLLFNAKWLARLSHDISIEIDGVMNECMSRLMMIAERYGRTLVEIEKDTDESREAVRNALGRMGYVW